MFASLSSSCFSAIRCPINDQCALPNCIFNHDLDASQRAWINIPDEDEFPDRAFPKRRKVEDISAARPAASAKHQPFVGRLVASEAKFSTESSGGEPNIAFEGTDGSTTKATTRPKPTISPPPLRRSLQSSSNTRAARAKDTPAKQESLNPRKLQKDPAGHATRVLYLQKLHEGMVRLNKEVIKCNDAATRALAMTDGQLITLALDEEEKIATESPSVYANVLKLRMVSYKKMTLEQWTIARLEAQMKLTAPKPAAPSVDQSSINGERPMLTGLTTQQELSILPYLLAKQEGLEQFGYVVTPPTDQEIANARAGVESSAGYEQCDRCKSRFQVFPDRREDGALTTGGPCTYHHGRRERPQKSRLDAAMGVKDMVYSCCGEAIGTSIGCITAESHVFKVYDVKRLAALWQYERTPENSTAPNDRAVAFDCEMGFSVYGMELIRITATSWPTGAELLDVLVRPLGAILDLNTRYSGVSSELFANALPYKETPGGSLPLSHDGLRIVDSPMVARKLLFKLLSPSTPLLGHSIENDLNVTRIVHPCIIDTVLLFPHPSGLPYRRALKVLVKQMLWRDIQTSTATGHDSKEDARATGDLVLEKVKRKWREMQRDGWMITEGKLTPPTGSKGHVQIGKRSREVGEE